MLQLADNLHIIRTNMLTVIDGLSMDQLTRIPSGFNNNMIWNLGHALATQQLLVYKLSGLPMKVDEAFVDRYRKGTSPGDQLPYEEDLAFIKSQLFPLAEKMGKDFEAQLFVHFQEYETSFGVKLHDAYEAATFNNLHETLHLGYMMAMKHCL